ncbi:MAG TPA: prenyltransferase/squalene oxidase repeat-containing protein [Paludibacteraceae bacterium]|nr:prenyltransferase/squalene oxidase repeat-containing protein [Paludibacteraceae bacterium]
MDYKENENLSISNVNKLYNEFSLLLEELHVSDGIKVRLLNDAFSKYNFYVTLPFEIAKLYPESVVNENLLIKLSFYSYLYFSSILCFDKYYDNQIDILKNKNLIRTFVFFVKEQALTGLLSIINQESNFWNEFNKLKIIFFESSNNENHIEIEEFSDDKYFEIARNKSILSYAFVYSLKYLFGELVEEKSLLYGLDNFHMGFQIYDDYRDLKEDKINNQMNYFNYKINKKSKKLKTSNDSFEYLLKLSYLDNTITDCLELALKFLRISLNVFADIKQHSLINVTNETIYLIESELQFIKIAIKKANEKSTKSNSLIVKNDINKAINLSLYYLQNNLNSNSFWEDFLTNAGYGKEWVTGYVLSMIGEINANLDFLSKPLEALLTSKSGYNNLIVQDGDSSNFFIKTSNIFNKPILESKLNSWFAFSKSDGGWATYYSNDIKISMNFPLDADFKGWFTPQLCVSTVSAWVAKDFKDKKISDIYTRTIEYIISNQNKDGSWKSYWWTENIYATAFAILALPKDEKYNLYLKKAVIYLINKQNSNGSWSNGADECAFYTALSLKSLMDYFLYSKSQIINDRIDIGINWLINNQMKDGSWKVSRILQIPFPDILDPLEVKDWRHTSFGLNCLVDDHNRIFTTSTVYNCLCLYEKNFK